MEPLDPFTALEALGPISAEDVEKAIALHREMLAAFAGLNRSDFSPQELERERECEERARRFLDCQAIVLRAHRDGRHGPE